MKQKIIKLLAERNIKFQNKNIEILYQVGMENVKNNIEFYSDKTYTCESVINELFIRGILEYLDQQIIKSK